MQNAPFDYVAEANVTASIEFHGSKVPADYLKDILRDCINNIRLLDQIKKTIFYGRELPSNPSGFYSAYAGCEHLPSRLSSDDATGELIFHSIVGLATEAGELLELLFASCFEGKKFDAVNFMEETGDCFWYQAVGAKAAGFSFDEAQRRNIAKLRHRFPNAFTEFDANNRDLLGERSILEGGNGCPCEPTGSDGLKCPDASGKLLCECVSVRTELFGPNNPNPDCDVCKGDGYSPVMDAGGA